MEFLGLIVIVVVAGGFLQFLREDPKGFMKAWLGGGIFVLSLAGMLLVLSQIENQALYWLIGVLWGFSTLWVIARFRLWS